MYSSSHNYQARCVESFLTGANRPLILIFEGRLDTPKDIVAATEMIDVPQCLRDELTPRIARTPILDLPHIFRDQLRNYSVRRRLISHARNDGAWSDRQRMINVAKDDLVDLTFLVQKYRTQIPHLCNRRNLEQRREFIKGAVEANTPDVETIMQTLRLQWHGSDALKRG